MMKNERLENCFLQTVASMGKMHLEILKNASTASVVHKSMNKNLAVINQCADEDKIPVLTKISIEKRDFHTIKLGKPRAQLKTEYNVRQSYNLKARKLEKER